jgi:hypothetical protein
MPMSGMQGAVLGPQIAITDNSKLRRIMLHEFRDGADFDPKPLRAYLSSLSPQQVRLLMSYVKDKYAGKHRLVIFITVDPKRTNRLMCADFCDGGASSVRSNAKFAVFHCNGVNETVTLVCYTEEFLLNNGKPRLFQVNVDKPKVYKVSAMDMTNVKGEGDVIWHRVSELGPGDQGIAIYGGKPYVDPTTGQTVTPAPNAMHGMINTVGCWMLFRNYNWFAPKRLDFFGVFRKVRGSGMDDRLRDKLRSLGYGETDDRPIDNRFFNWERNYSYLWFTREVIGIDYFSKNPFVNESNIYDDVQLAVYPAIPNAAAVDATADSGHSFWHRRRGFQTGCKEDPTFVFTNSLWGNNALGFQTATGFSPFNGHITMNVELNSWADLYAFTL